MSQTTGKKKAWVVFNEKVMMNLQQLQQLFRKLSKLKQKIINPKDLGFKIKWKWIERWNTKRKCFLNEKAFDGETGAIRDNVVFNTAALVVCEKVNSLKDGIDY